MPSTVTSRRRQLGNEIRRARTAAEMTQHQVAEILGCSQGKINKIESGAVTVKLTDLRQMIEIFHIGDTEAENLLALARSGGQRGQWSGYRAAVPPWFRAFTDLEPAAAQIQTFHGERIPGPAQSEHYMLKQFTFARPGVDVTDLVRNRLERRRVFDQQPAPGYHFILGEGALRRMPGGPNPMVALDQVQHLLHLTATYEQVTIRLLPFDARVAFVPNDFTIIQFADATKDFVFIEHAAGGQHINDDREFALFVRTWQDLGNAALDVADSRRFLENLADRLHEQVTH